MCPVAGGGALPDSDGRLPVVPGDLVGLGRLSVGYPEERLPGLHHALPARASAQTGRVPKRHEASCYPAGRRNSGRATR